SIDLENLEFSSVRTFKQDACSVCGSGKKTETPKQELILEELCGRNMGKRTFSITPTYDVTIDVAGVTAVAKEKGFHVENQGDLGLSMRTNDLSVNFMKKGSAVVVGPNNEDEAITLYKSLLGTKSIGA
ncbi:4-methyl-5(B-hydroxyethyl)-thiazole monophosphate biosynthesis protein, partial [Candidatus Nitrosopelagicus sp.]|nr:4-methyl-5(B-hydroxyethyl)-thiazole monophosphate biosynthesis protein [Candidatus Nitrosopelagicus sp.]